MNGPQAELRAIFCAALDQETPQARAGYLDQVCQGRPELRGRIEALLEAHQQASGFLQEPTDALDTPVEQPRREEPGTPLGPYQLLEKIGEGGFGLVYLAAQQQPVRRKVAVKILKPGMDSRQVVARFEAERHALALMDHANIAKVLDAGETSSGRPYFVMELCRGVPITDYCDQNALTPRQRLELFVSVCQAVQHAHQKGIIHRDIKPSNVLVTVQDGVPVVKVIDFGIAKALGPPLTDKTLHTGVAQLIGTPLYMSPEQAEIGAPDIDTRSDIYSLGVLLYELLTGTTPFDKERLIAAGYDGWRRIIREEEPPKPSTRLTTLGQAATTVSTRRRSDPQRLSRLFRGELDWIVMKALEKERTRRYETASAFAADVQRYLRDEPVLACPPSAWYHFRKFARRRRGALTMAAVVTAALVLAAGSIGWAVRDRAAREAESVRARAARDEALARDQAMRETALDAEVARALDEAVALIDDRKWPAAVTPVQRAEKLLVAAGRPQLPPRLRELKRDLAMLQRLEEILETAHTKKDNRFTAAEVVEVNTGFARAFRELDIDVPALPVAVAAERIRARSTRLELAAALDYWSRQRMSAYDSEKMVWVDSSGLDPEKAGEVYERTHIRPKPDWQHLLEVAKVADPDPWRNQLRDALIHRDFKLMLALAESAPVRELSPSALCLLGNALNDYAGEAPAALALLRKAQRAHPGDLRLNEALAEIYFLQPNGRDEVERFFTAALAVRPNSVYLHYRLGLALSLKGANLDAIAEFSIAIELDPNFLSAWAARGQCQQYVGRQAEAIADCSHLIDVHPDKAWVYYSRGETYKYFLQWDKAIADSSHAIQLNSKRLGWLPYYSRGEVYANLGQWDKAADDLDQAAAHFPVNINPPWVLLNCHRVACYRAGAGNKAGYRRTCQQMLEEFGQTKDPAVAQRVALSCLLMPDALKDPKVAEQLALGVAGNPDDLWFSITRGLAFYRAGQSAQTVQQLGSVLKTWPEDPYGRPGVGDEPVVCWLILAMAHQRLGQAEEASRWLDKAAKRMDAVEKLDKVMLDNRRAGLLRNNSHVWAMCQVLRGEVEGLRQMEKPKASLPGWPGIYHSHWRSDRWPRVASGRELYRLWRVLCQRSLKASRSVSGHRIDLSLSGTLVAF